MKKFPDFAAMVSTTSLVMAYNEMIRWPECQDYMSHPRNRERVGFKTTEIGIACCERLVSSINAVRFFVRANGKRD